MSVYFAQRQGLIKIGHSRSVPNRVCALKSELLGAVPGGKEIETELHTRFSHLRVKGEWFKPGDDLLSYIRSEAQDHKPDYANVQTAIRLSNSLLARIDKLAEDMSQPGLRVTRTGVLRHATFLGIDSLEAEMNRKR